MDRINNTKIFNNGELIKEDGLYTGRKIGIITDLHGLYEPLIAALDSMKKRGITEIYSLGDNIGDGPNPKEAMLLLKEYGVISVLGNAEEYIRLGIEPFSDCINLSKIKDILWTKEQLGTYLIHDMESWPHSVDLVLGGKKIGLCHYANDVRFDFRDRNVFTYQLLSNSGLDPREQFLYANSSIQKKEVEYYSGLYLLNKNPELKGYEDAYNDPLFNGLSPIMYDAIIQGHFHFKKYDNMDGNIPFYSIRALGMAYDKDPINYASYIVLQEKENGFDIEEVLVEYDRSKMEWKILESENPNMTIKRYVRMR